MIISFSNINNFFKKFLLKRKHKTLNKLFDLTEIFARLNHLYRWINLSIKTELLKVFYSFKYFCSFSLIVRL